MSDTNNSGNNNTSENKDNYSPILCGVVGVIAISIVGSVVYFGFKK